MITDPQAVLFCNQFVRTRGDDFAQTYYRVKQMVQEWDASGVSALVPNDATVVDDGSDVDGRTPITGANVNAFIETYARAWLADLEANSNAKLNVLLAISVNPSR